MFVQVNLAFVSLNCVVYSVMCSSSLPGVVENQLQLAIEDFLVIKVCTTVMCELSL